MSVWQPFIEHSHSEVVFENLPWLTSQLILDRMVGGEDLFTASEHDWNHMYARLWILLDFILGSLMPTNLSYESHCLSYLLRFMPDATLLQPSQFFSVWARNRVMPYCIPVHIHNNVYSLTHTMYRLSISAYINPGLAVLLQNTRSLWGRADLHAHVLGRAVSARLCMCNFYKYPIC